MMKEFKTIKELRADKELLAMGRYQWQKVKLNGEQVYACTTNQQYEDILWGGAYDVLEKLYQYYKLDVSEIDEDLCSDIRDLILERLEKEGIKFRDIYEEY